MKDKDFLYHCIDWGLAIILSIFSLLNDKYIAMFCIISIASVLSTLIVVHKNHALHKSLKTYELLLERPTPLYLIACYLLNQKKSKSSPKNEDIHLEELSLKMTLINTDSVKKTAGSSKCDVKYEWTIVGRNVSQHDLRNYFLRIAGEHEVSLEKLNMTCVDCSTDEPHCDFRDHTSKCPIRDDCKQKYSTYFTKADAYLHNSENLYIININLLEAVRPNGPIKLKVAYVWPQEIDSSFDYVFIDPSSDNFSRGVDRIRMTVALDNFVVDANSKIQMYSIDKDSNEIINEGQVKYQREDNLFERLIEVNPKRLYFITIQNE